MLCKQLDDLEQYTCRTNIWLFGIPEPTGTDPEDTEEKAIDFFANQLGITVSFTPYKPFPPYWQERWYTQADHRSTYAS